MRVGGKNGDIDCWLNEAEAAPQHVYDAFFLFFISGASDVSKEVQIPRF